MLNGACYLDDALNSIRSQTWSSWSAKVYDAGSSDGSVEIADRHACEDSRIEWQSRADNGQYDAVSSGLDSAPAGMITWLNSDDLYMPWAFETVARARSATGADWITGLPSLWDERGCSRAVRPSTLKIRHLIRCGCYHDNFLGCLQQESIFFHSDLWNSLKPDEKLKFANARFAGDFYLWTRFARLSSLMPEPVVISGFRVHSRNRSRLCDKAYQNEAERLGALSLPSLVARPLRNIFDSASAIHSELKFRRAARDLHKTLM